jgi:hypothetical protein
MQETVAVAGGSFKGMAECVAEVKEGANTLFRFIFGNDGSLGAATLVDGEGVRLGIAAQQDVRIGFQPFEE